MATNFTYSYTPGSTANLDRLRFLLGDHRGVPAVYTQATWITTAQAVFTDEELNDLLLPTMAGTNLQAAARIAVQCRINREAFSAGIAGTTDTSDRPKALIIALDAMARLTYPLTDALPASTVTTNADLDAAGMPDMGAD